MSQPSARSTNQIDEIIAERLRERRHELGLSQQALAKILGITFQQIQKYEKSTNRISASRLYFIAQALQCDTAFFFAPSPKKAKTARKPAKKSRTVNATAPRRESRASPRA